MSERVTCLPANKHVPPVQQMQTLAKYVQSEMLSRMRSVAEGAAAWWLRRGAVLRAVRDWEARCPLQRKARPAD
jgi:hypothetical protein